MKWTPWAGQGERSIKIGCSLAGQADWSLPRTGAEELAAGVGPWSDGLIGASLVDGKGIGLPIDFHGCSRVGEAEGLDELEGML